MIWHRQDSVQALQEQERLAAQKDRLAEQSVEAARAFAAKTETLSDVEALAMSDLFPVWEDVLAAGEKLTEGTMLRDGETLYRVVQAGGVVPQENQPPHAEGMLAVYRPIEPSHAGTADDPIPAARGMAYTYGLYYRDPEDGKRYLCQRTGEAPGGQVVLQHLPHELAGQYFTEA